MPKQSKTQKKVTKDVMHDYKRGKLKSGGSGKKVKNRKQAIAIAMHESGSSKYESKSKNKRNLRHTLAKKGKKTSGKKATKRRTTKKKTSRKK